MKHRYIFAFLIAILSSVQFFGCGSSSRRQDLIITKDEITRKLSTLLPKYELRIKRYPRSRGSTDALRGRAFGKYESSVDFVIFLYPSQQQEIDYRHLRPPVWKGNEVTIERGNYVLLLKDRVKSTSKKQSNEKDNITADIINAVLKLTPDLHGEP